MEAATFRNDLVYSTYVGSLERSFTTSLPVKIFGYIPRKTHRVNLSPRRDANVCVAIVTDGDGFIQINGQHHTAPIPFAFVQAPGNNFFYGPRTFWTEAYWVVGVSWRRFCARWRLSDSENLIRPLANADRIRTLVSQTHEICRRPHLRAAGDRIDILAEMAILEAVAGTEPSEEKPAGPQEDAVRRVEQHITTHYRKAVNLDEVAEMVGLSRSSFYRVWRKTYDLSPNELVSHLRLEHARRMLVEDEADIKRISHESGFQSPFYFARKFHARFGMSPSSYRQLNRRGRADER